MTALLLKSTAAILGALLLVSATRRGRASLRHLILAALFAFLLLLPLVQKLAPSLDIPVRDWQPAAAIEAPRVALTTIATAAEAVAPDAVPASAPIHWLAVATKIYLAVAALLLAWLALGVLRLRHLASGAEVWLEGTNRLNEIAYETLTFRAAMVVLSREVATPLTFGFRRSVVVLPYAARSWSADELTRALRHELEHVRREDWLLQLAARAACALYWPQPLVWMAWRRFCLEAERACDDAVIGVSEPAAYAGQLVSLARHQRGMSTVPALGMASRSRLAQRIDAILDPLQRRGPHGGFSAAAVLTALLVLLVGVAPARLIAAVTDTAQQSFNPDPDIDFNVDPSLEVSPYAQVLVEAAQAGDLADVRRLIKRIDVNTVAPGDGTALIGAARGGQKEVVDFLLDNNADPNLESLGDANPLIAAAAAGHPDIVQRLLEAGANIDEIVPGDENALMQAVWHGHEDVVRLLLARGADVNARSYERDELRTPLRLARKGGHAELERILLAAGASE
jgi:bla regulator protein BlaR1